MCRDNGMPFGKVERGIKRCDLGHLVLLTIDLVAVGEARPGHLINLFSSRRKKFVIHDSVDPRLLGVIRYVYENIFKRDEMKHSEVKNLPEFTQDMNEIRRRLLKGYTLEERLEGLSPEEREKLRKLLVEKSD